MYWRMMFYRPWESDSPSSAKASLSERLPCSAGCLSPLKLTTRTRRTNGSSHGWHNKLQPSPRTWAAPRDGWKATSSAWRPQLSSGRTGAAPLPSSSSRGPEITISDTRVPGCKCAHGLHRSLVQSSNSGSRWKGNEKLVPCKWWQALPGRPSH